MTTTKDIIDAARARSNFNDAEVGTVFELVAVIDRYMKSLYSSAARVNRYYFAAKETVAPASLAWARPSNAEMVFRAETTAGVRVNIVPLEDQKAELPPRVFELGQRYYPTGDANDPSATTDSLVIYYSKRHPSLSTTGLTKTAAEALTLDSSWPEQFNDLPVLKVSEYLAVKDSRGPEVELLRGERAELLTQFLNHLEHENAGMVSRWNHTGLVGLALRDRKD